MVETFKVAVPIFAFQYDSARQLALAKKDARASWAEQLALADGKPAGRPTVTVELNPSFGTPIVGEDGNPVLLDGGGQLTDQRKAIISVAGPAMRSPDPRKAAST